MRTVLLLFVCLAFAFHGQAQTGISVQYTQLRTSPIQLFSHGYTVSIDHRFRLKKYRVAFLPELSYTKTVSRFRPFESSFAPQGITIGSFHLNTNIYPFDFKRRTDFPTTLKVGNVLKKGFFVQFAPGINYVQKDYPADNSPFHFVGVNSWNFDMRAGLGLDIGVSDFLTLTPMVRASYLGKYMGESVGCVCCKPLGQESNMWRYYTGVRMGIRLNKLTK